MRKSKIVNYLARTHSLKSYLEIATPYSGFKFGQIDRQLFDQVERALYRCPADYGDGHEISYRIETDNCRDALSALKSAATTYDLIFIDPWHLYDESLYLISEAFDLLSKRGFMVVHDCNPPRVEMAQPESRDGGWCGLTYLAFLDFVLADDRRAYETVDSDFGCGVIRKSARRTLSQQFPFVSIANYLANTRQRRKAAQWRQRPFDDPDQTYAYFAKSRRRYLNLVSPTVFTQRPLR